MAQWGSNTVSVPPLLPPPHPFPSIGHQTIPISTLVQLRYSLRFKHSLSVRLHPKGHCFTTNLISLRAQYHIHHSRPPATHVDMRLISIGFCRSRLPHHAKARASESSLYQPCNKGRLHGHQGSMKLRDWLKW